MNSDRVLVVDDYFDSAEAVAGVLSTAGYHVQVASGGLQALDAFDAFKPHAVVLDVQMPFINGLQAAVELRRIAPRGSGRLVLIGLSALATEQDRIRAIHAGCDAYFTKPCDFDALLNTLAGLLAKQRPRSLFEALATPA